MLVKLLVTEVPQQAQLVLRPTHNVQPVTNGTSPLERLPDQLLTASGSGLREIAEAGWHPSFFYLPDRCWVASADAAAIPAPAGPGG